MKTKDIQFLINVARLVAEQSYAIRLKVGGVVADKDGNIIAYGYNGSPRGMDNTCETRHYPTLDHALGIDVNNQTYPYYDDQLDKPYRLVTNDNVVHCEQNLIAHAARRGISINGGMMFLTHSPCEHCASMIIQSGVKDVYYIERFRTMDIVSEKFKEFINFYQVTL